MNRAVSLIHRSQIITGNLIIYQIIIALKMNSDFVENKLDYMEDLGLYIDNMRYISQENCDDGIVRPQCDGNDTSSNQEAIIWLENAFENFAQNLFYAIVDFLFYLLQY